MSRRRRVLLWAGLLVVLAGAGVFGVQWVTTATVSRKELSVARARFRTVHEGMSQEHIEGFLGVPTKQGHAFGFPHSWGRNGWESCPYDDVKLRVAWQEEESCIVVGFDASGHAAEGWFYFDLLATPRDTIFTRLRRWLGL